MTTQLINNLIIAGFQPRNPSSGLANQKNKPHTSPVSFSETDTVKGIEQISVSLSPAFPAADESFEAHAMFIACRSKCSINVTVYLGSDRALLPYLRIRRRVRCSMRQVDLP
jgi:hypothetical protein